MSTQVGNLATLTTNNAVFNGTRANDIALYSLEGQSVWIGCLSNASSNFINVNSNGIAMRGSLTASNAAFSNVTASNATLLGGSLTNATLMGGSLSNVNICTNSSTPAVVVRSPLGQLTATIATGVGDWANSSKVGDAVLRSDSNMIFTTSGTKTGIYVASNTNFVGIGTGTPVVPLHVFGTAANVVPSGSYFNGGTTLLVSPVNFSHNIGLKVEAGVTAPSFIASSDVRMKTNVIDYNSDVYSLNPVKYEFIDKIEKGARTKYGFIAQDVDSLFPEVITKSKDYIPNIFKLADVSSDNIIHVVNHGLTIVGQKLKIIIQNSTDPQHGFMFTTVSEIIDDDHFKVSDDLSGRTSVFVYGIEVDDFHSIDHDQLLSIAINTIKKQKLVIDEILSEIADIKLTLSAK
jgi:hypothetical protein